MNDKKGCLKGRPFSLFMAHEILGSDKEMVEKAKKL
jgi:hypothetical protein